jgi:hypothetical protein
LYAGDRHAEFFSGGLRELSSGTLAGFDFASHHRNGAIFTNVDTGGDILDARASDSATATTSASTPLLGGKGRCADGDQQAGSKDLYKPPSGQTWLTADSFEGVIEIEDAREQII